MHWIAKPLFAPQSGNLQRNLKLAETVQRLARQKGCAASQLALAWVLAQGEDIVAIPGTKHVRCLEENLGAIQLRLSADELRRLAEAFPWVSRQGSATIPRACKPSTAESKPIPSAAARAAWPA